jgi:glycosyltransferase involved in cell wall biosynthesis
VRVAILIDGLTGYGGGITTYLETLIPALPAAGIEATFVAGQAADNHTDAEYVVVPGLDGDVARLPSGVRDDLDRALRQIAPDVCYVHVISPDASLVSARHAPVAFYAHEYLTVCPGGSRFLARSETFCAEGQGLRCFLRAYTERTTNRRPDRLLQAYGRVRAWRDAWDHLGRVLVATSFVRDVLVEDGAPTERVDVIPYPVVAPPASPGAGEPFDVLYLGRLIEAKGVDVLLRAMARLDGIALVVAGEGPQRPALEALARDLGLEHRVRFLGWVSGAERGRLLRDARVLALPSSWDEAFGIVGIEALGLGTPVVATSVGGIPSWLTHEKTGLLVPRADDVELAAALRRILDEPGLAAEMGAAGVEVASEYSVERHLAQLTASLDRARATGTASSRYSP